jgi:hypothetical protein
MSTFTKRSHSLLVVVLGLGLTLILGWVMQGSSGVALAQDRLAPIPPSLTRRHEPVVISGSLFLDLANCPLDEISVYAYQDATPIQIPFQIDERNADGIYVAVEDGLLDGNDELVFMAIDGGSWVDDPRLDVDGTVILPAYAVTLTDPISNTHAWAYVFRSAALSPTFTADYVSYDDTRDRITSPGWYTLGFSATHGFIDYLSLGNGGPNVLDRDKWRIVGMISGVSFSANEEAFTQDDVYTIDGPVRVTRVDTLSLDLPGSPIRGTAPLFAYRSLVVRPITITVPDDPFQITHQRISMDWNERALGMVYYDANNRLGTTIDGNPDAVITTPPTRWIQITGITGTIISVNNTLAGLGGIQSTYYKDDSSIANNDTGDQRSYGDAGFQVEDPNLGEHTVLRQTYFLTSSAANVGTTYADYYDNPIQVSVATIFPSLMWRVYLPIVTRG